MIYKTLHRKTKDGATGTPLKTEVELRWPLNNCLL
jgi:hypothetical protein